MAGNLSPRGRDDAQMKIRFIRYEEAPNYFEMEEGLAWDIHIKHIQIQKR